MRDEINALLDSPVFAMSLGSKELFHSNFWDWLIRQEKKFAKAFFPSINTDSIIDIKREYKNRDLTIHMDDGTTYVIENKIKSLPTMEQLEQYQENTIKFEKGLLTGIINTLELQHNNKWDFMSYHEIATRIKDILDNTNIKDKPIVKEYCTVLEMINDSILRQLENTEGYLDYNAGELYNIRMDDIFKKFKANDFLKKHLEDNYELEAIKPDGFALSINQDYSNKKPILDIRFVKWNVVGIGIQIEGDQFRLVAERSVANKCDEVFEEFTSLGWFDTSYAKENKQIYGYKTVMTPRNNRQYNRYQTSRYSFVYQYFNLTEETKEYQTLYNLVLHFAKKAAIIASNINLS